MRVWFWAWLVAALAIASASAVARDRASAPFALGAACAALAEALLRSPAIEWAAFVGVSSVVFLAVNRRRHVPRHGRRGIGRHSRERSVESG